MTAPVADPRFPNSQLIKVNDVGEMLKMHPRSVWRAAAAGDIPKPIRIGPRVVRWRLGDLQAFIEEAKP
jgi:predicted DNA-binding transcriptional regulator AlpA